MLQKFFAWVQAHERHLSALAMVAGFVVDNLFFGRVDDLLQTHAIFAVYTLVCFISIPVSQRFEARASRGIATPRSSRLVPLATQFALGGFWSGLVIFYGRSADFGSSWPFLIFLVLVLLGSEYFARYHTRMVFTSILFFFALYSYAIFAVPIYTGSIGTGTFLASGGVALILFWLFTRLLRSLARERFYADVQRVRAGALVVLVIMNLFYFTNVLPPLPLAAKAAGVYHYVWRVPGAYLATSETSQSWRVRYLGAAPTLHVRKGGAIYAYGSVFAPTTLATSITHRWERYDEKEEQWIVRSQITYPILGGRDGGYRGYSTIRANDEGKWRVSIETLDGRRIVRLPFVVDIVEEAPAKTTVLLK